MQILHLESISVASENTAYNSRKDCNAIIETNTNTLLYGCKNTVIPGGLDGVTGIGDYAFSGCTGLTSITIPASVTSIGIRAFEGCTNLLAVILNSTTMVTLGTNAFDGCTALNAIGVPEGTATAYKTADNWLDYAEMIYAINGTCGTNVYFSYNSTGKTLHLFGTGGMKDYDGMQQEYSPWNSYRTEITTVVIHHGVTTIGDFSFYGCTSLASVTIPTSVTTIGVAALSYTSLANIVILANVTSISCGAFAGCSSLESISVAFGNTKYHSEDNCLIETASHTLIAGCKNSVIPDDVTAISDYAFEGCTGLTSITIPAGVTGIGNRAFYGCTSLLTVILNSTTMVTLGTNAFDACTALNAIGVPAGTAGTYKTATNWSAYADKIYAIDGTCGTDVYYSYNSSTKTLTIFGIGAMADYDGTNMPWYSYRTGITSIDIKNGVTSIGAGAFDSCTNLLVVILDSDTPPTLGGNAFDACSALNAIVVPSGSTGAYKAAAGWSAYEGYWCLLYIRQHHQDPSHLRHRSHGGL